MNRSFLAVLAALLLICAGCGSDGGETVEAALQQKSELPSLELLDRTDALSIAGTLRLGKDFHIAEPNWGVAGNSLSMEPFDDELYFAIYRFDSDSDDILAAVGLYCSNKPSVFSYIYPLLANYETGRWEFLELQTEPTANIPVNAPPGRYSSPAGYTYLALLAWDGGTYTIDSVELFWENRSDPPAPWPGIGNGNLRRGQSSALVVENANVHWKLQLPGRFIESSPIQALDGTIYMMSYDLDADRSSLYSISPEGVPDWSYLALTRISATPALGPLGFIIYGDRTREVTAVNQLGQRTWQYRSTDQINGGVAILDDGSCIFGSNDSKLVRLDRFGNLLWELSCSSGIHGAPAVAEDGTVYACMAGGDLLCTTPEGTELWSFEGPVGSDGSPCILPNGNIAYACSTGDVYVVDTSGVQVGHYAANGEIKASPATDADGNIYIGTLAGMFYKLDPAAAHLADLDAGSGIETSAVLDGDGTVFFGTQDGRLLARNPDLSPQWQYDSDGSYRSSPMIGADGLLLAPLEDGTLIAFAPNAAVVPAQPTGLTASQGTFADYVQLSWDEQFDANGFDIYRDGSGSPVDSVVGLFSWFDESLPDDTHHTYTIVATNETGSSIPSETAEGWAIGTSPGAGDWNQYAADAANSGNVSLLGPHSKQLAWSYPTGIDSYCSPVIGAYGEIYFNTGFNNPQVYSIDDAGGLRWSTARSNDLSIGLAIDEQGYIYSAEVGSVFRLLPSGVEDWAVDYTNYSFGPPTLDNGFVFYSGAIFGGSEKTIKLDPSDGSEEWSYGQGGRFCKPAIGSDGRIYVSGNSNRAYGIMPDGMDGGEFGGYGTVEKVPVVLHDLVNGDLLAFTSGPVITVWKNDVLAYKYPDDTDDVTGLALMPTDDGIVTIGDECSLIDLDGNESWTAVPSKKTEYAMPAVDGAGYIYYGDNLGIFRCVSPSGSVAWDYDTGTDLRYSTPAIGPGGRVYVLGANGTLFAFENAAP
ncbi:PQQ-binding-like beta-propeller repeat protein [bacterium]|nr:PQQ-binding-like beta-propeller repeat protein [bacterium]